MSTQAQPQNVINLRARPHACPMCNPSGLGADEQRGWITEQAARFYLDMAMRAERGLLYSLGLLCVGFAFGAAVTWWLFG